MCVCVKKSSKRKRYLTNGGSNVNKSFSRGRWSYSRLLSPFHLQLPLCLDPSPGAQTPLSTSASSTSSSRGVRPEDMPASDACIRAKAQSQGPRGVRSHTQTCLTQLYKEIQNNNTSSSGAASLGALALGHDTGSLEGTHTHTHARCRRLPPPGGLELSL